MSNQTLIIVFFAIASALGLLFLWSKDYFYTARTGKPASERIREMKQLANAPISKAQYYGRGFLYLVIFVFWLYGLGWSGDFRRYWKISPIFWMLYAVISFCQLQLKWNRQKNSGASNSSPDQLTGSPR